MSRPTRDRLVGPRLALSWLTVLPVTGPPQVDRRAGAAAIRWAPLAGLMLGGLAIGVLWCASTLSAPPLIAGLLAVATLGLATRGMHLDGLADTADGLGCYGPPARALEVMRDGGAGPFAVVSLLVGLGLQASSLATLADSPRYWLAVPLAVVVGRCAFGWCCRRGVSAARPDGLGALVADSQPPAVPATVVLVLAVLSLPAVPGRPWQGPLAVLMAAGLVIVLSAHTTRRFGGLTGDVLGACAELSTTAILVVLSCGR